MKRVRAFSLVGKLAVGATLVTCAFAARADTVTVFPSSVDFTSSACQNYGDFISCSGQYLNLITTGDVNGDATTNYVDNAPQGDLADELVIFTGGEAATSNESFRLTGGTGISDSVDDAYRGSAAGSVTEYGTHINTFGDVDPDPSFTGDNEGAGIDGSGLNQRAWDIGLEDLIFALTTPDDIRHDMYIMFDNNQVGTDPDQNILSWALVCVQGAGLTDVCYELIDQNGRTDTTNNTDPTSFSTSKTFGEAPDPADYVLVNGTICVDTTTLLPTAFNTSSCPAGSVLVNNNLGTNDTEFIASIPEFNANMESLLAAGYTNVAVQFRFTNNNDGFEDIYILAGPGAPTLVPEPGTLALLGGACLAAFGLRRRKVEA